MSVIEFHERIGIAIDVVVRLDQRLEHNDRSGAESYG